MKSPDWSTVTSMNAVRILFLCLLSASCGPSGQEIQWGKRTFWIQEAKFTETVVTAKGTFSASDGMVFVEVELISGKDGPGLGTRMPSSRPRLIDSDGKQYTPQHAWIAYSGASNVAVGDPDPKKTYSLVFGPLLQSKGDFTFQTGIEKIILRL